MAYYENTSNEAISPRPKQWYSWATGNELPGMEEYLVLEEDPIEATELPVKKVTKPRKPKPKKKLADNLLADVPSLL